MVLSEETVSRFVEAAWSRTREGGIGPQQRKLSREVVQAGAAELELDPASLPLPRFAAGESSLAAAVRLLKLARVEKALEQHRRQRAAAEEVEQRFAALARRRDELRVLEADRLRESVKAGRVPARASKELRGELDAIRQELETIPASLLGRDLLGFLPSRPEDAVIQEALSEREWLAVSLYVLLLGERVRALTVDEPPNSRAHNLARIVDQPARGYARHVNVRAGHTIAEEHQTALRAIAAAVERADLYSLPERRERTLDELAGAAGAA